MSQPLPQEIVECRAESGPGACCAEAQADGVPCAEIRDCEHCGRARVPFDADVGLATAT